MAFRCYRFVVLGLAPLALAACTESGPAAARLAAAQPAIAVDLGSSSRMPQVAGLAGEGEGRRASVTATPAHKDHGSMPATDHGAHAAMPASSSPGKQQSAGGGTQMAHSGHGHAQGTGTVNSIDAAARKVNVTHDPIPAIGWPTMTMDFAVAPAVDLNAVAPGTRVNFDMEQGQGGMYVIQSIKPARNPAGPRPR